MSVSHTRQKIQEERKGKKLTNRRNKSALVPLSSQHENRKHQLSRQEHLNKQALRHTSSTPKLSLNIQRAGEHALHERTRRQPAQNLRDEKQPASNPRQSADQAHSKSNSRVEQSAANAEEHPSIHRQTETEGQRDVLQLLRVRAGLLDG